MDAAVMEVARLVLRQEAESEATPVCAGSNDYDGRMGVRISSIFVIFVGSLWGKSISSPAITSGVWCSYITAISFGIWRSHPYNSLTFDCHMIFFSLYIYIYICILTSFRCHLPYLRQTLQDQAGPSMDILRSQVLRIRRHHRHSIHPLARPCKRGSRQSMPGGPNHLLRHLPLA